VTLLLDANVLVALFAADHVHHDLTSTWFTQTHEPFATTPITQGSALRFLLREGVDAASALEVLRSVTGHRRHEFWPDDVPFSADMLRGVIGHRQVTDAYLANQARRRGGKIATLDKGLVALHADVATLVG
jgi:Predicted nucleic acid-binding protein, contains PIN domain